MVQWDPGHISEITILPHCIDDIVQIQQWAGSTKYLTT